MTDPILIAGAGPVGLMLACELGLADVPTVVLEQLGQPRTYSRGMAINAAVVELLAQRGLMDPLREDGLELPMSHFAHLLLDPARLDERHPFTFAVPHSQVERRLEERARDLGVEIRRGARITSVEQDDGGVRVGTGAGGPDGCVTGRYLIGCDGAGSTVRTLAGIGFPGTELVFNGLTGDVDAEPGHPLYDRLGAHQHGAAMFTVAPTAPGVLRVTTGEFGVAPPDPAGPVTLDELAATARRITGAELPMGTPRWLSRWDAPTRIADRLRAGRVFLAGDAAHVCFPLGGQALSTGIEDAVNLGWKLAGDVHGWAPAGLLDTYQSERLPVAMRVGLTTRAQTALMQSTQSAGPLRAILSELIRFDDVNAYLVKMVGGLDVRYEPDGEAHPLVGSRLPEIALRTPDGTTPVARLLESGHGLLIDFGLDPSARELVRRCPGPVDVVTACPSPQIDAAGLLLRPDGRVAWAAEAAGAAACTALPDALGTWFGGPARVPALSRP